MARFNPIDSAWLEQHLVWETPASRGDQTGLRELGRFLRLETKPGQGKSFQDQETVFQARQGATEFSFGDSGGCNSFFAHFVDRAACQETLGEGNELGPQGLKEPKKLRATQTHGGGRGVKAPRF